MYTFFFLRTYVQETGIWASAMPIGHLWSLNIEEHAYILMSLLTLFLKSFMRIGITLISIGLFSILWNLYTAMDPSLAWLEQNLHTEVNLAPILFAGGYALIKDKFELGIKGWMPVVAIAITAYCFTTHAPWYLEIILTPFLLAFAVNHLDRASNWFIYILNIPALRLFGLWSFSLYIWQQPFYRYSLEHELKSGTIGFISFSVSLVVAVVSYYFFENPVRKYINKYLSR
jgi:peptidoglycan/LPS O-acetylase OafA/YrhL